MYRTHKPVTEVDTADEALAVSMGEKASIDMEYMMELSGESETKYRKASLSSQRRFTEAGQNHSGDKAAWTGEHFYRRAAFLI